MPAFEPMVTAGIPTLSPLATALLTRATRVRTHSVVDDDELFTCFSARESAKFVHQPQLRIHSNSNLHSASIREDTCSELSSAC